MDADLLAMATSTVTTLSDSIVDLVTDIGPLAIGAVLGISVFSFVVFKITRKIMGR